MIPILHHYDASPFSRKAQKMLGIKKLAWVSIEMPMTAPKPDIERLTGGYRGTPVLQLGADIFVDNLAIAEALDGLYQDAPLLMGKQSRFIDAAIGHWADALFDPVLRAAVGKYSSSWDDHFLADRKAVFPHLDFDQLAEELPLYANRIAMLASELNDHLASHGPFINGPFIHGSDVSLADVHCWGILWFVLAGLPETSGALAAMAKLQSWYSALDDIGFGDRVEKSYDYAWQMLEENQDAPPCLDLTSVESFADWVGKPVAVKAEGADRGTVLGRLEAISERLILLAVTQDNGSEARVHLPRAGYSLDFN